MRRAAPLLALAVALALAACGGGEDARPADVPLAGVLADPGQRAPLALTPAQVRDGGHDLAGQRVVVRGRFVGSGVEPAPALALAGGGATVLAMLPQRLEGAATDLYVGQTVVVRGVVQPFTEALDAIRDYPIEEPEVVDRRGRLVVIADQVRRAGG